MSDFLDRISKLSAKRLALLALEQHEQLEAAERHAPEPIAVIGMACRFPGGADDPAAFWELLQEGRDAICEVPSDRWDIEAYFDSNPDAPGRISARNGGFLSKIGEFDAAFFGIAPREALTMDPQHRLLLETSWQALEHAGVAAENLVGSPTGVFIGISTSDYFQRLLNRGEEAIDGHFASGNAHSVAAGRVAYCLGLQGPALAIDTSCSSSLVALHVACRSIRSGESRVALAGGVNLICSPETMIAMSKSRMLASDGRCKTFDAAADGFSRGEGCGVLVLKRLTDAVAEGDRVLALIKGSAVNQDGRSGGLTVPNGPAQENVIRAALRDAGVHASDIDYVEAHGTGTPLGDPIEVRALAGALGAGRSNETALLIGSVKTNIGHLEAAAGVAGVVKVILSLQNERLPAHLHFREPNPHIDWQRHPVRVLASGYDWPRNARRRLAGVSSFGFSGTNAHVVIEEAPAVASVIADSGRPVHCLPLSARSGEALRELASEFARILSPIGVPRPSLSLADVAHTAGVGRSRFAERLAIVAEDASDAHSALMAFCEGRQHEAIFRATAEPGLLPEVVFLFTGQGSQYAGMAQQLYEISPVFRAVIDRCDELLGADPNGRRLKAVLKPGPSDRDAIHETVWTQPALFAVEYALTELWRSWGIEPAAVIGHSVGEYVAACVAGVFSLEDGLKLIAERGRLMQALPPGGAMAAIFAPAELVARAVEPMADRIAIAAFNAPDSIVVSGDAAAVDALLASLAARNVQGQRLIISFAAHSPLVEPALEAMEASARAVPMFTPRIPVAWNLTGGAALTGGAPDAVYWRRHLREPVRFAEGIQSLYRNGYRVFLEVGPHPTLMVLAQRSLPEEGPLLLNSLRRGASDWRELMTCLARLQVRGAKIDWASVDKPHRRARVTLPTYPFERRPFWVGAIAPGDRRRSFSVAARGLSGARWPTALPIFETVLTPHTTSYLGDHCILGRLLAPGSIFTEIAQAAAHEAAGGGLRAVERFVIHEPLVLSEIGRAVQTHLGAEEAGALPFSIHSRAVDGSGAWHLHATGWLASANPALDTGLKNQSVAATRAALGPAVSIDAYHAKLASLGIDLGPAFRCLSLVHRRDGEALAQITLPNVCTQDLVIWAHPVLVDGAVQSIAFAVPESSSTNNAYLFTGAERIALLGQLPATFWCHSRVRNADDRDPAEWIADVTLSSLDGSAIGVISGVRLRRAPREALSRAVGETIRPDQMSELFYKVSWESAPVYPLASRHLVDPPSFVPRTQQRFGDLAQQHGLSNYEELLPELDRLSGEYVAMALRELGFDATPGRRFDAANEIQSLQVATQHERLFMRLLDILVEDNVLDRLELGFEVLSDLPTSDTIGFHERLMKRFASIDGELSMLRRCGPALANVLRGEQDPLQALFPGGSFDDVRRIYVDSSYAQTYNRALGEALQAAAGRLPAGARLRVLEIGAGTGGTTSYVLPTLAAERTEYTFTDLSPMFLDRAAEQFKAYPFLRTALLDIERDPVEQGFAPGMYDVVIAANVLHATIDLTKTLKNVQRLMAPGAMLFLLEGLGPERWVDLTFGLTAGWWRFTDTDLRPHYPLISRTAWLDLLQALGYRDVASLPGGNWVKRRSAQQALIVARAPTGGRSWTLLCPSADEGASPSCFSRSVAAYLAEGLRARGDAVTLLSAHAPQTSLGGCDEVVYLNALDLGSLSLDDPAALRTSQTLASELPQRWLAAVAGRRERVWLITQGAQAVGQQIGEVAAWQAPIWGWGRGFAIEHPTQWGGLIDLPFDCDAAHAAGLLLEAFEADDEEDQTAWRAGRRWAARLIEASVPAKANPVFRPDATYLLTGGFGGLGLVVARWMVEHGARHIALLGRHPDPDAEGVRAIEALGATVHALQADVADEAAMSRALGQLRANAPAIRGVMHAATAFSAVPLTRLSALQIDEMLRSKIAGTVLLERLTRQQGLDFLVLFSSTTALLGASGLSHYAAANAFLDAFARKINPTRRVISVNWGPWEVMRNASEDGQRNYLDSGLKPMASKVALDGLGRILAGSKARAVVASVDWRVLKSLHEARRVRPLLRRLGVARHATASALGTKTDPDLQERLRAVPATMRSELLIEFVQYEVAAVLGLENSTEVPLATGLFELGMDSLMAVELNRRLERLSGRPMPSTLTFNYPNVAALAKYLETQINMDPAGGTTLPMSVPPTAPIVVPLDVADLDGLNDEELEARLMASLERAR
jgi:acyl transferase domain-containing protein/acyl carrier protein